MLKPLSYFFTAILLIAGAKLLEVAFLDEYEPHEKKVSAEVAEKAKEKQAESTPEKVVFAKTDTTSKETISKEEIPVEQPVKEQKAAPVTPSNSNLSGEDYFQNLKNSYLSPIIAELPQGRSRVDVVVRYYKHNMDNKRVYALRSLGYYLHEKEPEDSEDLESNVLYYGKDVDVRDIQIVAYTLLQSGVPLRSIRQSQFDWKSSALEIGTDSLLQESPLLTVGGIRSFQR